MDLSGIVKAYDVRGTVPDQLDEPIARALGAAFIDVVGADRIVTAHDMRETGPGLARAFAEHNSNLRTFLSDNYGYVLKDFAAAFARLLPQLDKQELYWRLDIAVGALTYAMADFGMIQRRSGESEREHREQMAKHLIHFTAAGLRA